ncbi:MAG: ribosome maturation factor RimM [Chloroflexi bacterium]|nr:ribosome maturation factor RimM [Chloroflexota bacterium]
MVETSEMEFITIGEIVAPQGTKGKLKVKVLTDFPHRFAANSTIYVNHQPTTIETSTWYKGMVIIKLPAIDSLQDAERLRGEMIEIHPSQLQPLQEGQYYIFQLIGLEVWTTAGELLGNIKEIITAKSNDNYVVSGDKGEFLIPAIEDVVKSVDLETKRMVIEPLEGLLELNKKTGG